MGNATLTNTAGQMVHAVSLYTGWVDLIEAGGMTVVDNGGARIVEPALITHATRKIRRVIGHQLLIRLAYDVATGGSPVAPTVQVFGEDSVPGSDSALWNGSDILKDRQGVDELTLAIDLANDIKLGALRYTSWAALDTIGDWRVLGGVKTALSGGTGNLALAKLEGKFV